MEQNTDRTYQTIPKGRGFLYAHANQLYRQVKKHGSTRYLKCYYDFCDGSTKLESGDFSVLSLIYFFLRNPVVDDLFLCVFILVQA